jgi:hypothetical protein
MSETSGPYKSPEEFLDKMDHGELDGKLCEEIKKLTREQMERIARILTERESASEVSPVIFWPSHGQVR